MKTKDIYLVANYFAKPREHVRTSQAGWMNDTNNIRYDEVVNIVNGLKDRDRGSKVILNLSKKRVEANGWTGEKDFDRLFVYFYEGYADYLQSVMKILDPEYLDRMTKEPKDAPESQS